MHVRMQSDPHSRAAGVLQKLPGAQLTLQQSRLQLPRQRLGGRDGERLLKRHCTMQQSSPADSSSSKGPRRQRRVELLHASVSQIDNTVHRQLQPVRARGPLRAARANLQSVGVRQQSSQVLHAASAALEAAGPRPACLQEVLPAASCSVRPAQARPLPGSPEQAATACSQLQLHCAVHSALGLVEDRRLCQQPGVLTAASNKVEAACTSRQSPARAWCGCTAGTAAAGDAVWQAQQQQQAKLPCTGGSIQLPACRAHSGSPVAAAARQTVLPSPPCQIKEPPRRPPRMRPSAQLHAPLALPDAVPDPARNARQGEPAQGPISEQSETARPSAAAAAEPDAQVAWDVRRREQESRFLGALNQVGHSYRLLQQQKGLVEHSDAAMCQTGADGTQTARCWHLTVHMMTTPCPV